MESEAQDATQAEIEVVNLTNYLIVAEERYRRGEISKKELEKARAALEAAKTRAANARQFYNSARGRLGDLRKPGDP